MDAIAWRRGLRAVWMLLATLALALWCAVAPAYAEGSKDLVENGGFRPYTERYNASTAGESRLTEVYAYVKEGETVSFGTSVKGATARFTNEKMGTGFSDAELASYNTCDVIVCKPDWVSKMRSGEEKNTHAYPWFQGVRDDRIIRYDVDGGASADGGADGYVGSCAREAAGPVTTGGAGGYAPFEFTADPGQEGVYLFKFLSEGLTNENPKPYASGDDGAFSDGQKGGTVAAWDVTVSKDGKTIEGRVFTDKLFLNMGGNLDKQSADVLKSHMFAVTDDNYHYEIDFNGMDPYGFVFFANNRGLLAGTAGNQDATRSLYHSVKSVDNAMSDLPAHSILLNNTPATASDKTYKLFFNNPTDDYVLDKLGIRSPTGSDGISGFKFTGASGLEGEGYVGEGGDFSFVAGANIAATSYEITLKFGDGNAVTLSNSLVKGAKNTIHWDGLDANGKAVGAGTYGTSSPESVAVKLKGGEVHFPLLDVETSANGIRVARLDSAGAIADSTVYYNNSASNAGDVAHGWTEANWAVADKQDHSVNGVDTASAGAMAYGAKQGDQTALDVWAYHDAPVAFRDPYSFTLKDRTTSVTVVKTWEHGANQNAKPAEATVRLVKNGFEVAGSEVTLNAGNGWKHTWDKVDALAAYTVKETNVPDGYSASSTVTGSAADGWSVALRNTYTGDIGKIVIKKTWKGAAPAGPLEVQVLGKDASGVVGYNQTAVLTAAGDWTATLAVPDAAKAYWFSASEKVPAGYRQVNYADDLADSGRTLIFTFANEKVRDLTAVKAWKGDEGNASHRTPVQLQLLKDGVAVGDPVTAGAPTWSATWKGLADDGSQYAVYEVGSVDGYASDAPDAAHAATFVDGRATVANTYAALTTMTVEKAWNHGANPADRRPDQATVRLVEDGSTVPGSEATLDAASGWTHTWGGLDPAKSYTVAEDFIGSYHPSITVSGNNVDGWRAEVTNTFTDGIEHVIVNKAWKGAEPSDPLDVKVTGMPASGASYTLADLRLDGAGHWSASASVPNGGIGAGEDWFSVTEAVPAGYRQLSIVDAVDADNHTLTFTLANAQMQDLTVTKRWDDDGDAAGARPASVFVQLLKDGAPEGDPVLVGGTGDAWDYTWSGLDAASTYAVYEVGDMEGYTASATSTDPAGFVDGRATITNTYTAPTSVTVDKSWNHGANQMQPASVQVRLVADGAAVAGSEATLDAASGWTYTWENLDPLKAYAAEEVEVPLGYEAVSAVTGSAKEGYTVHLGNAYAGSVEKIVVKKAWVDLSAPDSLTVRVRGTDDSGATAYDSGDLRLDARGSWQTEIALGADAGKPLLFAVSEVLPDNCEQVGLAQELSADGTTLTFTLTNRFAAPGSDPDPGPGPDPDSALDPAQPKKLAPTGDAPLGAAALIGAALCAGAALLLALRRPGASGR